MSVFSNVMIFSPSEDSQIWDLSCKNTAPLVTNVTCHVSTTPLESSSVYPTFQIMHTPNIQETTSFNFEQPQVCFSLSHGKLESLPGFSRTS